MGLTSVSGDIETFLAYIKDNCRGFSDFEAILRDMNKCERMGSWVQLQHA